MKKNTKIIYVILNMMVILLAYTLFSGCGTGAFTKLSTHGYSTGNNLNSESIFGVNSSGSSSSNTGSINVSVGGTIHNAPKIYFFGSEGLGGVTPNSGVKLYLKISDSGDSETTCLDFLDNIEIEAKTPQGDDCGEVDLDSVSFIEEDSSCSFKWQTPGTEDVCNLSAKVCQPTNNELIDDMCDQKFLTILISD